MAEELELNFTPVTDVDPSISEGTPASDTNVQTDDDGLTDLTEGEPEVPEGEASTEEEPLAEGEEPPEGETAEEKAERERVKAEEASLTDEEKAQRKLEAALDAPINKTDSQRTQDRIRTLIDSTREVTEKFDQVNQQFNTIVGALQRSNTSPTQFREYLEFRSNLSSGDVSKQKVAFTGLCQLVQELSDALGEPLTFKNPVEKYPDLIAEVQGQKISLERAEEIARARSKAASSSSATQQLPQGNQTPQQLEAETTQARKDLTAFEQRMTRNDPSYGAKRATLIKLLKPVMARTPPREWKATFERAYRDFVLPAGTPGAKPAAGSGNQPMRHGKRPAGTTGTAPKSLMDAINAGIASATR